jgi:hypothetical protein
VFAQAAVVFGQTMDHATARLAILQGGLRRLPVLAQFPRDKVLMTVARLVDRQACLLEASERAD